MRSTAPKRSGRSSAGLEGASASLKRIAPGDAVPLDDDDPGLDREALDRLAGKQRGASASWPAQAGLRSNSPWSRLDVPPGVVGRAEPREGVRLSCERIPLERVAPLEGKRLEQLDEKAVEGYRETLEYLESLRERDSELRSQGRSSRRVLPELPLEIVVKRGKRLRLIDGHHRFAAAKALGLKEASFLVGRR